MKNHPHDEIDLVGAYVLDSLDDAEAQAFERHLATCTQCTAEVIELRQVVAVLPLVVEPLEPPASLRDRIFGELRSEQPEGLTMLAGGRARESADEESAVPPAAGSRWLTKPVAFALGAAAIAILGLGVWGGTLQNQLNNRPTAAPYESQVAAALASGATVWQVSATAHGRGAHAVLVQPPGRASAYFLVTGLPPSPSSQVYELWLMRNRQVRSAGIFSGPGSGTQIVRLPVAVNNWHSTGVTLEPGPNGTTAPTTPVLLAGILGA